MKPALEQEERKKEAVAASENPPSTINGSTVIPSSEVHSIAENASNIATESPKSVPTQMGSSMVLEEEEMKQGDMEKKQEEVVRKEEEVMQTQEEQDKKQEEQDKKEEEQDKKQEEQDKKQEEQDKKEEEQDKKEEHDKKEEELDKKQEEQDKKQEEQDKKQEEQDKKQEEQDKKEEHDNTQDEEDEDEPDKQQDDTLHSFDQRTCLTPQKRTRHRSADPNAPDPIRRLPRQAGRDSARLRQQRPHCDLQDPQGVWTGQHDPRLSHRLRCGHSDRSRRAG